MLTIRTKAAVAAACLASILAAQSGRAVDPPAEEKYKNIQVFQGMPSSRILPTMFFMRGSLGVSCTYCHVDFSNFEKDDNPKKATARKMIRMVRDLNQNQFDGQTAINCNTCHRGQPKPAAALTFAAIVDNRSAAKPATTPTPDAAVPAADEIFARYIASAGGKSAQEKLAAMELTGSMLSSEGWVAPLIIDLQAPGKVFITYDLTSWPAFRASNGNTGWSQDNHGLHDLSAQKLALLQREAAFFRPQRLKEQYVSLTSVGRATVGGREAWSVLGKLPDEESETLSFDVKTGLLIRISSHTESLLGPLPNEVDLDDYREVAGVKIPFMVLRQAPDFSSAYKIEHAEPRATFDGARFEKPTAPLPSMNKPSS